MIKEIEDHGNKCTWHDPIKLGRCNAPAVMGSAKTALCHEHVKAHRKLTMEPEAYAEWLKAVEDNG